MKALTIIVALIGITAFDSPALAQGRTFLQIPAASNPPGASDSIIGIQSAHDVRFSLGQLQTGIFSIPITAAPTFTMPVTGTPANDRFNIYQPTTSVGNYTTLFVQRQANHTGGTLGNVSTAINAQDVVSAGVTNDEFALLGFMDNKTTATNGANNVGGYLQAFKESTGATWAATIELRDYLADPTTASATTEVDMWANGTDTNGRRTMADYTIGKAPGFPGWGTPVVTYGIRFTNVNSLAAANGNLTNAIYFNNLTYGVLLKTAAGAVATDGIDFSAGTFSGSPFKSTGFSVGPTGGITSSSTGDTSAFSFVPPGFGGTWLTNSLFTSTYAPTHIGNSRSTLVVNRTADGSGDIPDFDTALWLTASKTNYLSSTVDGSLDALHIVVAQGGKGDTDGIVVDVSKVAGVLGGAGLGTYEGATKWIDSSGNTLDSTHVILGFGQSAAGPFGQTIYGLYTENWGATHSVAASQIEPIAGLYVGTFDPNGNCPTKCPYFQNAIIAAGDRSTAHVYFTVKGGLTESGDIVIGSATATGADGNPTQSGGTPITLGNHGGLLTISSNINVPTSTPASQTATCTTGTITWDTGFIYVCTGTDHWRRAALSNTAF